MKKDTSWEKVNKWYSGSVDLMGNYYHQHVVIPKSLRLLDLKTDSSLLDLACGQGVLARHLSEKISYLGLDLSNSLLDFAKKYKKTNQDFFCFDITKTLKLERNDFTHSTLILALQNLDKISNTIQTASNHLKPNGKFLIVINHPCFRVPKNSSWQIDEKNNIQYRRIDKYMSSMEISIDHEPSKGKKSPVSYSYHYSLSTISDDLSKAGFRIVKIEEWLSNKESVGKNAKRENIARKEFPLFMAILCEKKAEESNR